jgi:TPR repeat protein
LGELYEDGQGVAEDWGQAAQWYRKAAAQGNTDAQDELDILNRRVIKALPLPAAR